MRKVNIDLSKYAVTAQGGSTLAEDLRKDIEKSKAKRDMLRKAAQRTGERQ